MKLRGITAAVLIWSCFPALAQQNGAALYSQHCAQCHDFGNKDIRAPDRSAMRSMTFEAVLGTITSGSMASMVEGRTRDERAAIASFVTGKVAGLPGAPGAGGGCVENAAGFLQSPDGPRWNGWGADLSNSRFQPAAMAGLTPRPGAPVATEMGVRVSRRNCRQLAQPTIVGGLVFVGGGDRKVYALDAKSGCTRWAFTTEAPVRTAISFAPICWYRPVCRVFWRSARQCLRRECDDGRIGLEDQGGGSSCGPDHRCANPVFRRSVCAGFIDRGSHRDLRPPTNAAPFAAASSRWIARPASRSGRPTPSPRRRVRQSANAIGTQLYGPSGAAVWSAPTIDVQRQALYVATGNSYSDPPTETSDAILAFDLATGRMLWHRQATAKDSFIMSCFGTDRTNCPENHGPDHDFGQSPILVSLRSGQRVLVIGQKSGVVHALDPDQEGKILWQTRVGKGGPLGGIMWGSAADQDHVYVANSDVRFIRGGTRRWIRMQAEACSRSSLPPGKSSMQVPPVPCGEPQPVQPCALRSGHRHSRCCLFGRGERLFARLCDRRRTAALGGRHGARLCHGEWRVRPVGVPWTGRARPSSDGMLYVNSGYAQWGGLPGNVLLAFEVGNP